ncbi:MAG: M23 family metallopeptidase [Gammaproteobacteria bacterium]|nr:M23 family metallopeptidase [Gammaproteobacteria bacterium]
MKICVLALLSGSAALANPTCKDHWICVDEIRDGDRIELRARNLQEYPLTYTLRVNTRSYAVNGSRTVTRTLNAGGSETAMELVPRDGNTRRSYDLSLEWTVGDQHANHDDYYRYAFPYERGRSYRILQGYGSRFSHRGREEFAIDFDMPVGTPVHAARAGTVARVVKKHDKGCWESGCGNFANYIVILHDDGTTGEYYHLQRNGALVEVGDAVDRGQLIGLSGNTGHPTMPHLHFAVYRATSWGNTQSIPVIFESADGIVNKPRRGGRHQAAY